ncbi:hypothetical protein PHJA_001870400 [Phtheirospermum japonicum]|uniref:Uncharacterized protein n=1 Tax=Phtheirospermum japonicum TaxID=374723 RepID=A0A830CN40_9LAMI|nr:hypothetical protein PHJA_001870400 [Phtheirospermum japonicum]
MSTKGASGVIFTKDTKEKRGMNMKMENPFTLKVGQVFTGFGIGCGVGIGVGRPLNLGALPVLSQVMVATRGATDAFSGVHRHVNHSLRKVGAKNIEAGIGCGVGFGHGFGVGLAVKPAVLHQIQSKFLEVASRLMTKFGIDSDSTLSINEATLTASLQTGTSIVKEPSPENPAGSISPLVKTLSNGTFNGNIRDGSSDWTLAPKSASVNTQYSRRTEKVLNNFLTNPLLKEERSPLHEQDGALQLENNVLQMYRAPYALGDTFFNGRECELTPKARPQFGLQLQFTNDLAVLKHQLLIEELMQENEKLRQILVEELKVQPSKFQSNFTSRSKDSCTDCFECRRKQRKSSLRGSILSDSRADFMVADDRSLELK